MNTSKRTFIIRFLNEKQFNGILELGDRVFGNNYLTYNNLEDILEKSTKNNYISSFSLNLNEGDGDPERVIGFRLTYAPGTWIQDYDLELSPNMWGVSPDKVAYMKSNCLDEEFRGSGFGRMLLDRAVAETKRQGAEAAVSHIWMHSPNNGAFRYFSRAGGQVIKEYPRYWASFHNEERPCVRCGPNCECSCSEMLIEYKDYKELQYV